MTQECLSGFRYPNEKSWTVTVALRSRESNGLFILTYLRKQYKSNFAFAVHEEDFDYATVVSTTCQS